ncbi:polysaccharide export protein [Grosmannia clavigera kw1407]|uniref:Polysaccharide export protein n=1 Tax=Grosmannia clavigera (strain kw1407 / UAMH 11150) TaxID=655863 RepID=F0XKM7_GROCL|nr:polysaccharide export protein [Grosmannia clavigera kw1407]EFX01642.1 polysaccharide export protein [Grosmannia clavigera kw1407]
MKIERVLYKTFRRFLPVLVVLSILWNGLEAIHARRMMLRHDTFSTESQGLDRIFIASLHWNSEKILRESWLQSVVELAESFGRNNVFFSIFESGSWDGTKSALGDLDSVLAKKDIPRRVILDNTTHLDEISRSPTGSGWIKTPQGKVELRRIPYLARLRNTVLQPLYENSGARFDKILFLGDVAFTTADVYTLLSTRGGNYAAACSLDFSSPPNFYDTFALRDSDGHGALTQTWPYFRSRASRKALIESQPVPVTSCWNGIVAMDAAPFYDEVPLTFRGIADSLATKHLEGSECCLIHADNRLSDSKGIWLNPNVRVGYDTSAYKAVHSASQSWVSSRSIVTGLWKNCLLRWLTTPWMHDSSIGRHVRQWKELDVNNTEGGAFCLIDEMQVLVENGWGHR